MKHGIVRAQHNGTLKVTIWLRDIQPLEPAPFRLAHVAAGDAVYLFCDSSYEKTMADLNARRTSGGSSS